MIGKVGDGWIVKEMGFTRNCIVQLFSLVVVVGVWRWIARLYNILSTSLFLTPSFLFSQIHFYIPQWPKHESPTNCTPLTPRDTERDLVPVKLPDVREVMDLSENTEST